MITGEPWKATRDKNIEPGLIKDGWIITGENGEIVGILANGSKEGFVNMLLVKGSPRLLRTAQLVVEQGKPYENRRASDLALIEAVKFAEGHH